MFTVHSPLLKKRLLWNELKDLKNLQQGICVFFGDLDVVSRRDERINSQFCQASANDFNDFITSCGLQEFSMGGLRFTYLSIDCSKLSKLDRFLVCPNFVVAQPRSSVVALPREHSDNSPLILCNSNLDFGPPPFRCYNSWLLLQGCSDIIKASWFSFHGYGTPDMYLMAKLKFIKQEL